MKRWVLDKRLGDLRNKMKEEPTERAGVFDFERTFMESEKALINKMNEFYDKFESNPSAALFEANLEVILKADEILLKYAMYTLREIMLCQFGDPESEIEKWYFDLHFYNFFLDLTECWQKVHKWPEEEKEEFLKEMHENCMKNKVYRIPRG